MALRPVMRHQAGLGCPVPQVGSIVDLRLGFLAEANASSPWGFDCMHGPAECEGNALQLCTQRHFPLTHDMEGLGVHSWYAYLECVDRSQAVIPSNTDSCLTSLGIPPNVIQVSRGAGCCEWRSIVNQATGVAASGGLFLEMDDDDTAQAIHRCAEGSEGKQLLSDSVQRAHAMCGHHSSQAHQVRGEGEDLPPSRGGRWAGAEGQARWAAGGAAQACKSCSMWLAGQPACVMDGGSWYNCTVGPSADPWVEAICKSYTGTTTGPPPPDGQ